MSVTWLREAGELIVDVADQVLRSTVDDGEFVLGSRGGARIHDKWTITATVAAAGSNAWSRVSDDGRDGVRTRDLQKKGWRGSCSANKKRKTNLNAYQNKNLERYGGDDAKTKKNKKRDRVINRAGVERQRRSTQPGW